MGKEDGRISTVIRKDLREKLFAEDRPGTLINDLLEKYFSGAPISIVGKILSVGPSRPKIIRKPDEALAAAKEALDKAPVPTEDRAGLDNSGRLISTNGVCKIHGTPLDSRGCCLQKGCKYA